MCTCPANLLRAPFCRDKTEGVGSQKEWANQHIEVIEVVIKHCHGWLQACVCRFYRESFISAVSDKDDRACLSLCHYLARDPLCMTQFKMCRIVQLQDL